MGLSQGVTGGLVRLDDTSLYVEERGEGPAVIVLHGGPGMDHEQFADYLDLLCQGFRLIFVDQRAHGRSERPPRSTWTLSRIAQDVIMLARALDLDRYAVLGHSWGASVALQNAVDYPGMASVLVVANGVPSRRWGVAVERNLAVIEPPKLRLQFADAFARYSSVVTEQDCAAVMKDLFPFYFADPRDPRIEEFLSKTKDALFSPEMFQASAAPGPLQVELEERLVEIQVPTLLLAGRFDRACAPEASEAMAAAISGSELHILEASGHMTYVEEQRSFLTFVGDFLHRNL
jgi:proline iminopeptidase